jgi:hypothetical protein
LLLRRAGGLGTASRLVPQLLLTNGIGDSVSLAEEIEVFANILLGGWASPKCVVIEVIAGFFEPVSEAVEGFFEVEAVMTSDQLYRHCT